MRPSTPTLELVVIGASAGGLEALTTLLEPLPPTIPAAILVVVHTRSEGNSYLPEILARRTALPVAFAAEGARLRSGHIYVAPPDFHLLVDDGRITLGRGPKENGFRPAVDPLFRSASRAYGNRLMAIVLSGGLDDGTYGMKVVKEAGGITVVQDPQEAMVAGMPQSAIRHVGPHHILDAARIGELIATLSGTPVEGERRMARRKDSEPQDPADSTEVVDMQREFGPPTGLTCPDCGGALWEQVDGKLARYRCHVGHQYSTEALDVEQHEAVEGALWTAVRVLEEHAELRRRMAARSEQAGLTKVSEGFENGARDAHNQAAAIRSLLFARRVPEPNHDEAAAVEVADRRTPRKPRSRKRSRR